MLCRESAYSTNGKWVFHSPCFDRLSIREWVERVGYQAVPETSKRTLFRASWAVVPDQMTYWNA